MVGTTTELSPAYPLMTRAELLAAKKNGHTHAVTIDRGTGERKIVSTHRSYDGAAKAMRTSKSDEHSL